MGRVNMENASAVLEFYVAKTAPSNFSPLRANSAPCWAISEIDWSFLGLQISSLIGK